MATRYLLESERACLACSKIRLCDDARHIEVVDCGLQIAERAVGESTVVIHPRLTLIRLVDGNVLIGERGARIASQHSEVAAVDIQTASFRVEVQRGAQICLRQLQPLRILMHASSAL